MFENKEQDVSHIGAVTRRGISQHGGLRLASAGGLQHAQLIRGYGVLLCMDTTDPPWMDASLDCNLSTCHRIFFPCGSSLPIFCHRDSYKLICLAHRLLIYSAPPLLLSDMTDQSQPQPLSQDGSSRQQSNAPASGESCQQCLQVYCDKRLIDAAATQFTGSETLVDLRKSLTAGLKQYPDFPQPGILFEDIFPLFADVNLHRKLIQAFILTVKEKLGSEKPDIIVGLDARGFMIGPQLALALDAGFVPLRKPGKLPGQLETVEYKKEYGTDSFAIQKESIRPGNKVLVVDDLIATGGSAGAAEVLVKKCGGQLLGFLFLIELTFLDGRSKLSAPVFTVLESQAD